MKRPLLFYALIFICLTIACTGRADMQKGRPPNDRLPDSQKVKTDEKRNGELQKQIEQIAANAKGHVGVAALLLETGETVSLNPQDHFPMQSVYKLPIGMCVLQQVDAGKIKLDQRVRVEKTTL